MFGINTFTIEDRPFFASLVRRMVDGNPASVNELTRDSITTLWVDELASDGEIAMVYGVTAEEIRSLRRKYGVNHTECIRRYYNKAVDTLGAIGASIMLA